MKAKATVIGLSTLLVVTATFYFASSKEKVRDAKESAAPQSTVNNSLPTVPAPVADESSNPVSIQVNEKPKSDRSSPEAATPQSPFSDENYEDWVKLGANFASEKERNPAKYKAGVDFLVETLKTGNVDKMLSQAAGTLYNINDPELAGVYEGVLNEPDANVSPEGTMRLLTLYIRQANTESSAFKQIINKYQKSESSAVKAVAQRWQEFR